MNQPTHDSHDVRTTTLDIAGMTCGACERHVLRALEGLTGVLHVAVDLDRDQAIVEHLPSLADGVTLVTAVRDAGYEARVAAAVAGPVPTGEDPAAGCSCCGCCAGE